MPRSGDSSRARREVSAGGVVFQGNPGAPRFVLIRANGRWSFPKGAIEKGETPAATALREISEETGLPREALRIAQPLNSVEYAFRWEGRLVLKTVHNFLVSFTGDAPFRPQLSEVDEARWYDAAEARQVLGFKNALETLDAAIAAIAAIDPSALAS
ncbi:MAG: NUDIX domain-containing protein [Candidatus Dormibacteraeota bacterium]|nr:NUDIX domain-containing protein [Candidatus Dormibacteraeota bacterium]